MKYELKIGKPEEGNGRIDFRRLALLAEVISKVAEGALQLRLRGVSFAPGRKQAKLDDALKIELTGIRKGSTRLLIECDPLGETLQDIQFDAFRHEAQLKLAEQTPMSLFMLSYHEALDPKASKEFLDKPLLNQLKNLQRAFRKTDEVFHVLNEGKTKELVLKRDSFKMISALEESIPESERIVLKGTVDLLHKSRSRIRIKGPDGVVDGFLSDELDRSEVKQFWGEEVTVVGMVHFRAGGRKVIEVQRFFPADSKEDYFAKRPRTETAEQQIARQLKEKGGKNNAKKIIGKWPGDEELDALLGMLTS